MSHIKSYTDGNQGVGVHHIVISPEKLRTNHSLRDIQKWLIGFDQEVIIVPVAHDFSLSSEAGHVDESLTIGVRLELYDVGEPDYKMLKIVSID